MDLQEIQHAIAGLPQDQRAALAAWIADRDQEEWETEIECDFFSPGGAGLALIEEMKAEIERDFSPGAPRARAIPSLHGMAHPRYHRLIRSPTLPGLYAVESSTLSRPSPDASHIRS